MKKNNQGTGKNQRPGTPGTHLVTIPGPTCAVNDPVNEFAIEQQKGDLSEVTCGSLRMVRWFGALRRSLRNWAKTMDGAAVFCCGLRNE